MPGARRVGFFFARGMVDAMSAARQVWKESDEWRSEGRIARLHNTAYRSKANILNFPSRSPFVRPPFPSQMPAEILKRRLPPVTSTLMTASTTPLLPNELRRVIMDIHVTLMSVARLASSGDARADVVTVVKAGMVFAISRTLPMLDGRISQLLLMLHYARVASMIYELRSNSDIMDEEMHAALVNFAGCFDRAVETAATLIVEKMACFQKFVREKLCTLDEIFERRTPFAQVDYFKKEWASKTKQGSVSTQRFTDIFQIHLPSILAQKLQPSRRRTEMAPPRSSSIRLSDLSKKS